MHLPKGRLLRGYVRFLAKHHRKLFVLGVTFIIAITAVSVGQYSFMIEQTEQSVGGVRLSFARLRGALPPPPLPLTRPAPLVVFSRRTTIGPYRARSRALTATRSSGRARTEV
jgi:hypothetical protein